MSHPLQSISLWDFEGWVNQKGRMGRLPSKPSTGQISRLIRMKAMRVNPAQTGPPLLRADVPQPQPQAGEVLVHVQAAGVIVTELGWYPTLYTKNGSLRTGAIPAHEFSGTVAALGEGVTGFEVGQPVYGMNDWYADGALAEFCLTQPESIAAMPKTLDYNAAASVPISALTAWQGLLDRTEIHPGERLLVQGGAGAVGIFAVQLGRFHGAHVIATAAGQDLEFVARLGADEAFDYRSTRFENAIEKVDVIFDTVGGDTLDRSWSVLKPGGRLVTIASSSEKATQRAKDAFFIVEPSRPQLEAVARMLDSGSLKTFIKAVVPLDRAADAYSGLIPNERSRGKIVVSVKE